MRAWRQPVSRSTTPPPRKALEAPPPRAPGESRDRTGDRGCPVTAMVPRRPEVAESGSVRVVLRRVGVEHALLPVPAPTAEVLRGERVVRQFIRGEAVSPNMVSADLVTNIVASGGEGGFETPGTGNFWWPLIGGDSAFAFTRPALVLLISVGLIAWFFVGATGKLSVVPTKRQFLVEGTYNFVRNTLGRDIIGTQGLPAVRAAAVHALHPDPGQQRLRDHPLHPVPDVQPAGLPAGADGDRLPHLPRGRHPAEARRPEATSAR